MDRINNPKKYTAEVLSAKYNIDLLKTNQLLRYYGLPTVITKYEKGFKCAVWPADAIEILAVKKGMDDALGTTNLSSGENMTIGESLYMQAEIEVKQRKQRKKKYKKAESMKITLCIVQNFFIKILLFI